MKLTKMISKRTLEVPLLLLILGVMGQGGVRAFNMVDSEDSLFYTGPTQDVFWGLTDANRTRTCILLTGILEILIPYETDYFTRATAKIPIPRNASVSGYCGTVQSLTLNWAPDPSVPLKSHEMTFTFVRKGTKDALDKEVFYELAGIRAKIAVNELEFPNAFDFDQTYTLTASNLGSLISAQEQLSYYCKSLQVIQFDDGLNNLAMSFVHAEAFHTRIALGDGSDFGPKSFCSKDGMEVMLMVLTYMIVLALIGLAIFYIWDRRKRADYVYL